MNEIAPIRPEAFRWRQYQKEAIDDRKRIRLKFWCRQSGKDECTAFQQVLNGLQVRGDRNIVSLTQRQADLTHEKCARHARAMAKVMCPEASEDFDANIGGKSFTFTRRILTLPTGVRIKSLPGRDPDALVGDSAHLVLTEFALFPNGGYEHWRRLTPMALNNGFDVDVMTTPRGRDTKAYELRQNPKGRYSVSTVDIRRAVADGLILRDEEGKPCSIEAFKEIYNDAVGWETEYEVRECEDIDALIGWADIEASYEPYEFLKIDCADDRGYDVRTQNLFAMRLGKLPGRLTAGWDVARKKHLSVLWVNEQVGSRHFLRMLVIMRRCTFAYQCEGLIGQMLDTLPGLCGCGDSTGLGMDSNERLERKYGPRWRGVNFAGGRKLGLASRLVTAFQGRNQVLPKGAEAAAYDIHSLQKQMVGDKTIIHETSNPLEPDSHCDMAFAAALAHEAAAMEWAEGALWVA